MNEQHDIRVGVVGCGDVLHRVYLPALATVADQISVMGYCDPEVARCDAAVNASQEWAPHAGAFTDLSDLFAQGLDAVINLTPVSRHFEVTSAALEANLDVYSEKPLSSSYAGAQTLVAMARERERMLLCAPATIVTDRYRWLRALVDGGRIGTPTLVTAQFANRGPAVWKEYTGDATAFYRADVGPLIDQGMYLLHAITDLLGNVTRVEAFARTAVPLRHVVGGSRAGEAIRVDSYDHILVHLEFEGGSLAQVLSSYAVTASRAPTMEVHGTEGSISFIDQPPMTSEGPLDVYFADRHDPVVEGWLTVEAPWPATYPLDDLISAGLVHFIRCLTGDEEPILTPDHACKVLEVIEAVYESASLGAAVIPQSSAKNTSAMAIGDIP